MIEGSHEDSTVAVKAIQMDLEFRYTALLKGRGSKEERMWLVLGAVGGIALTRFILNLSRSHKTYPNVWEYEFRAWHLWDQAANLATGIGAFAGIALWWPLSEYYMKVPGEANDIVMPTLTCIALLVPGAILGSVAAGKKRDAGIK